MDGNMAAKRMEYGTSSKVNITTTTKDELSDI